MTVQLSKTCNSCSTLKDAGQFYFNSAGRLRSRCKACYSDANRNQNTRHREKRIAYDRQRGSGWNRSGRAKYEISEAEKWDAYLRRTYGISADVAEQMFAIQQAVCAICQKPCNRSTSTRLCVDHDHTTEQVRGLLCFQCNVGLGKFRDNADLLLRAASYLEMR